MEDGKVDATESLLGGLVSGVLTTILVYPL